MKRAILVALGLGIVVPGFGHAALPSGAQAFLDAETVTPAAHEKVPVRLSDPRWTGVLPKVLRLAPQRTVRMNDATANRVLALASPLSVSLRVVFSKEAMAVFLEWPDATESRAGSSETDAYVDSIALEFPTVWGRNAELPYVGMGDETHPVEIISVRAGKASAEVLEFTAKGFGTLERRTDRRPSSTADMAYDRATSTWKVVVTRRLDGFDGRMRDGLLPFALAAWDGASRERAGNKRLSSWRYLRVPQAAIPDELLTRLAWGYGPSDLGNPEVGRVLAHAMCAACHHMPGRRVAQFAAAPDLSAIGAIASYPYLRDSLEHPDRVVVHSLLRPRATVESSTIRPRTPRESSWSTSDDAGVVHSRMPTFSSMTNAQVGALVAFLKTLDGSVP
jgi:complex iron-sulfur molybdoenzyme family reductase subunit gamma